MAIRAQIGCTAQKASVQIPVERTRDVVPVEQAGREGDGEDAQYDGADDEQVGDREHLGERLLQVLHLLLVAVAPLVELVDTEADGQEEEGRLARREWHEARRILALELLGRRRVRQHAPVEAELHEVERAAHRELDGRDRVEARADPSYTRADRLLVDPRRGVAEARGILG
eukprot:2260575-Prymnesium_polylepis.1